MAFGSTSMLQITELDPNTLTPRTREIPTKTCAHCNQVVLLNPLRERPRGLCRKCMRYICDQAGCHADCNPIEECVDLARQYPHLAQPFLLRDANGYTMHDLTLRDKGRPH